MATRRLTALDLTQQELRNARIQNLASAPGTPVAGQLYFDTTVSPNRLYYYNGSAWVAADGSSVTYAAVGDITTIQPDDAAAAGTAATSARGDHRHAIVAAAAGASAVGDTAAEGTATSFARSDHRHSREAFGSPSASAVGDAAADGTATTVIRSDHVHAREGFGAVSGQTSFGQSSGNGTATTVARSDHTHGTPAHGDAAHGAVALSALSAPTADVSWGGFKITNLGTPTASGDAATKGYVDNAVNGLDWKASVRVATTANIALSGLLTVDGVTLVAGDRVLVKGQTTAADNGLYAAASGAWARTADADTSAEVTPGMAVFVEEGTANGNQQWVLTTDAPITLGTTSLTFAQVGAQGSAPVAGAGLTLVSNTYDVGAGTGITVGADTVSIDTAVVVRKYATDVGDGAAVSFVVTHNLGTRDVTVGVRDNASPYDYVQVDVEATTTNTVTVRFGVAPASAAYRVVVHG